MLSKTPKNHPVTKPTLTPTASNERRPPPSTSTAKPINSSLQTPQAIANSEAHFVKSRSQLLHSIEEIHVLLNDLLLGGHMSDSIADSGVYTGATPNVADSKTGDNNSTSNSAANQRIFYLPRGAINRKRPTRRYGSYDDSNTP